MLGRHVIPAKIGWSKAYVEGIAYFKKNRAESVEVMKKKLRTAPAQTKYLERWQHFMLPATSRMRRTPRLKAPVACSNLYPGIIRAPEPPIRNRVIDASIVKELDDPALSRSSTNRRSKWHCLSKSAPIQVTAC
jgi:hypothetical protein